MTVLLGATRSNDEIIADERDASSDVNVSKVSGRDGFWW